MNMLISRFRGYLYSFKCRLLHKRINIGRRLSLTTRLKIIGEGSVYIGNDCVIGGISGDLCKYVTIDTHSKNAVIRIGNNASLYAIRISSKYGIDIGDNVLLEDMGILDTDFHSLDKDRGDPLGETYEKCKITIGNNVCVGVNSLVTKGVSIGDNVVVAPGSVVTMSIKPDSVVSGNPARPIKSL